MPRDSAAPLAVRFRVTISSRPNATVTGERQSHPTLGDVRFNLHIQGPPQDCGDSDCIFFFVVVFVFVVASVGLFFGLLIFGGTQKVGKRFWFGRGSALIHNVLVAIRLTIWMAKQQEISSICFKDSKCSFIASVYKGPMITGDLADQTVAAALVTETN